MDEGVTGRVTSVLRRPDGLFAVVSRRREPFVRPLPPRSNTVNDILGVGGTE